MEWFLSDIDKSEILWYTIRVAGAERIVEILYSYPLEAKACVSGNFSNIRWLAREDYPIFAHHLELCGQRAISKEKWEEICRFGTVYCGLFHEGNMIARACREVLSDEKWEIADVRVVSGYRNQGYALEICRFVLAHILSEGKTPTIRTEKENLPMQRVIQKLGFLPSEVCGS